MGKGLRIAFWIVVVFIAMLFLVALLKPPADDDVPRKSFDAVALLVSWLPMLLLIAVWLLFMAKLSPSKQQRRGCPAER